MKNINSKVELLANGCEGVFGTILPRGVIQ